MAIEIVDFPIEHGDLPLLFVGSPGRVYVIGRFSHGGGMAETVAPTTGTSKA